MESLWLWGRKQQREQVCRTIVERIHHPLSPHTGPSSTCPSCTQSARLRWPSVRFMTSLTPTEMGHQTTWPFTCGFLFRCPPVSCCEHMFDSASCSCTLSLAQCAVHGRPLPHRSGHWWHQTLRGCFWWRPVQWHAGLEYDRTSP